VRPKPISSSMEYARRTTLEKFVHLIKGMRGMLTGNRLPRHWKSCREVPGLKVADWINQSLRESSPTIDFHLRYNNAHALSRPAFRTAAAAHGQTAEDTAPAASPDRFVSGLLLRANGQGIASRAPGLAQANLENGKT